MSLINVGKFLAKPSNNQLAVIALIMLFRPLIMLTDKAVPMETRQYAATREFFTELFGLANVVVFAKSFEMLATLAMNDRIAKAASTAERAADPKLQTWLDKIGGPLMKADFSGFKKGLGDAAKFLGEEIGKQDFGKLSAPLQKVKSWYTIFSYVGVVLATAIFTPILNNVVINDKVLNTIKAGLNKLTGHTPTQMATLPQDGHGAMPQPQPPEASANEMAELEKILASLSKEPGPPEVPAKTAPMTDPVAPFNLPAQPPVATPFQWPASSWQPATHGQGMLGPAGGFPGHTGTPASHTVVAAPPQKAWLPDVPPPPSSFGRPSTYGTPGSGYYRQPMPVRAGFPMASYPGY